MTAPAAQPNPAAKPAPENPKVQAMDFALQLAAARSTGSVATIPDIRDLISWAETIHGFIK